MTSALMLARVRTALDEATAAFWSDAELYRMLSDGQREIASFAMNLFRARDRKKLPAVLNPLLRQETGTCAQDTTSEVAITYYNISNFWDIVFARYTPDVDGTDDNARCRIVDTDMDLLRLTENAYTKGTVSSPLAFIKTKNESTNTVEIFFKPDRSGSSASAVIAYIRVPTDISASVEPILEDWTHNAIVQYAYSQALTKDQRTAEANAEYQKFQDFMTRSIT